MKKKIAFIFPGQGSQKIGMGKDLFDNYRSGREVFQKIDEALNDNLSNLIFNGDEKDLELTRNTQPALLAVSMAIIKVLENELKIKTEDLSKTEVIEKTYYQWIKGDDSGLVITIKEEDDQWIYFNEGGRLSKDLKSESGQQ